ncbi:efflux RND transporter periplasmic adaptor subunit [Paenibacillus agricola]|uniref:Efflux RND transporter periplasmic adaptor subunit n=1 Tax=Paenibacillus agricola TaxID=2716264 RepID=A0ABX0J4A7_9BACL|nr:efflux RND transporter periplasmic adaptor subunit [Paenibacillus agricola]NHN29668.1 efflux RND transporter periplasmic adaptor subunit [Paenibacillus agricola]
MKIRPSMGFSVVLSLALIGALSGCSDAGAGNQANSATADVPVKVIKLGQVTDAGWSGKINPNQEVKIVSKMSGKVSAVNVEEGAHVNKGDVLVQLETDDLIQQLKQAESGVIASNAKLADTKAGARSQEIRAAESAVRAAEAAQAQTEATVEQGKAGFEFATNTYNRLRNQFDSSSSVTKEDLDRGGLEYEKARTGYEQAQAASQAAAAQVDAARAKLELAQAGATPNTITALQADVDRLNSVVELANNSVNNATITAPSNGTVIKRSIQPGEMAQPGVALFSVVDMNQVQVELSVTDTQIGKVKAGTAVDVKAANVPDQSFPGTITFVSPVSNANSNTFPVKVTVDNKDGLLFAGAIAEVHMKDTEQSRLEVPKSALIKKDGKDYVVKVESGTARMAEVKTSDKNQEWVYVEAGSNLQAGQQIVVNPNDKIVDGAKLKVE